MRYVCTPYDEALPLSASAVTFDSATYGALLQDLDFSAIELRSRPARSGGKTALPWLLDSHFAERRGSKPWLAREIMLGFVISALWKNSSRPPSHWTREPYIHTYILPHTHAIDADLAKDRSCLQGLILKKRRTLANEAVLPAHGQGSSYGGTSAS